MRYRYPVSYAVLVMPLTISSLLDMTGAGSPTWLLVLSTCIYALGGLTDTLVFILTRRSFIRNASSSASRSRSRSARPGGAAPERHRLEGITVTRHELTVVDIPGLDVVSAVETGKEGYVDDVSQITPVKEDSPFDGSFYPPQQTKTEHSIMWASPQAH
jgi:hypothetical protein